MKKYKLISFESCPYVQRAVIALNEKKIDFDVEYIDLSDKPEWFLKISPRGKVPVLVVNDTPLFESQAICEYLDEANPDTPLLSKDLVLRARERAWCTYSSDELFIPAYRLNYSPDETVVNKSNHPLYFLGLHYAYEGK